MELGRSFSLSLIQDIIIALARICRLDLMGKLFKKVFVPEAVWREVTVEGKPGREKIVRQGSYM